MAEGHLTQQEVDESLLANNVSDEQFAKKLKEFTSELEDSKQKQKQGADAKIENLNKIIKERDSQIQDLSERLETIEKANYLKERDTFVAQKWKKVKRDTMLNIILALFIFSLWFANEYYCKYLHTLRASLISVATFIAITFGILFFDHTKIKDYFCRRKLTKRFEEEFDKSHKQM